MDIKGHILEGFLTYLLGMVTGAILMLVLAVICIFADGYRQYRKIGYSRRMALKLARNYTF